MHNGVIVGVLRQRATFASLRSGVRIPYAPPNQLKSEPMYIFVNGMFGCIFPRKDVK